MRLLPLLCNRDSVSLDVGANKGVYTWHLRRLSSLVHAYEPIPELALSLRSSIPGCVVHECALSDEAGSAMLRIPLFGGSQVSALASLSQSFDQAHGVRSVEVQVRRLDDDSLGRVGFIKIDAEGHERKVLAGARDLLMRQRPSLLVEIEERHAPGAIEETVADLAGLGYEAYFLDRSKLRPMAQFDPVTMQDPAVVTPDGWATARYINNFIFIPVDPAWPNQRRVLDRWS